MANLVFCTLPSAWVDLDGCTVSTLASEIEDDELFGASVVDRVVTGGQTPPVVSTDGSGHDLSALSWAATGPDEFGHKVVVVDVPAITMTVLSVLWLAGAIPGDLPKLYSPNPDPDFVGHWPDPADFGRRDNDPPRGGEWI